MMKKEQSNLAHRTRSWEELNMSEFYSLLNKPERKASPAGSKITTEHRIEMGKNGVKKLIKDKKIDVYSLIQANKEQTEIEYIMRRAKEGDPSVLAAVKGQYIDITDAPNSLAEAQAFINKTSNEFLNMPWSIRKEYNNDPMEYLHDIGTEHWAEVTGLKAEHEKQQAIKEAQEKFIENQTKAIENLANGHMLTNTTTEGGSDNA